MREAVESDGRTMSSLDGEGDDGMTGSAVNPIHASF